MIDRFFNLDFYQDWWWNLAMVAIIFYVGIWGYAQVQPAQIRFETNKNSEPEKLDKNPPKLTGKLPVSIESS